MDIKSISISPIGKAYLENLVIKSKEIYNNFKKVNVFQSETLKEMFSPKYIYKGSNPNVVLVKSLETNQPIEVHYQSCGWEKPHERLYDYEFYDYSETTLGYKYFYIRTKRNADNLKEMASGYMVSSANNLYSGLGIREDELQIKDALENNLDSIPRFSLGYSALYHTKMGFLPISDMSCEIHSRKDVNSCIKDLIKDSPDINPHNFHPIITKQDGNYYFDKNTTQTIANVEELKQRFEKGFNKNELKNLKMNSVELELSGVELEYWKSLIYNNS